jgi:hypothetical protein
MFGVLTSDEPEPARSVYAKGRSVSRHFQRHRCNSGQSLSMCTSTNAAAGARVSALNSHSRPEPGMARRMTETSADKVIERRARPAAMRRFLPRGRRAQTGHEETVADVASDDRCSANAGIGNAAFQRPLCCSNRPPAARSFWATDFTHHHRQYRRRCFWSHAFSQRVPRFRGFEELLSAPGALSRQSTHSRDLFLVQ